MKVYFSLICIILIAISVNANVGREIDFRKVKVIPNIIVMPPLVKAPEVTIDRNRKAKGRIINGYNATSMTQFPYQVRLFLKSTTESTEDEEIFTTCGASIISPIWLVTAAHCIATAGPGKVYFGCLNWQNETGSCKHQRVEPENLLWHADYYTSDRDTQHDIGLIRLNEPLEFSENVNQVELNRNPTIRSGQSVLVSGYGITEKGDLSDILKYTSVQIISGTECRKTFATAGRSMICFGSNGYTSDCQGDSGGPMTMNDKGKITLVGVTSYGGPTCLNYPGVYTRISFYLDWICENTGVGC